MFNLFESFEIIDSLSLNLSIINTKTIHLYNGQILITIFIVGSALILYSILKWPSKQGYRPLNDSEEELKEPKIKEVKKKGPKSTGSASPVNGKGGTTKIIDWIKDHLGMKNP